jgi:hypothetical protein
MAWMEGKLQPIDLLSALQMKRQRDEGGNSNSIRQNAMELEQLKAMQEQNKMAELKRGLLTPGPKTRTMDSPYTIGFPEYQQEQEKIKYAAMATGQPLPNQGFIGGGGGDSSEPTPGDSAEQVAKTDLLKQQGNLAEEQARMVQQQRSGYGSATKDLLADQQLKAGIANKEATDKRMMDIAQIESQGRIDAAKEAAKGKVDAEAVKNAGDAPEKENDQMKAERGTLYKMANDYGLTADQLSLVDRNLKYLFADSGGKPIPWGTVMKLVLGGNFKDISSAQ